MTPENRSLKEHGTVEFQPELTAPEGSRRIKAARAFFLTDDPGARLDTTNKILMTSAIAHARLFHGAEGTPEAPNLWPIETDPPAQDGMVMMRNVGDAYQMRSGMDASTHHGAFRWQPYRVTRHTIPMLMVGKRFDDNTRMRLQQVFPGCDFLEWDEPGTVRGMALGADISAVEVILIFDPDVPPTLDLIFDYHAINGTQIANLSEWATVPPEHLMTFIRSLYLDVGVSRNKTLGVQHMESLILHPN